LYRWLDSGQDDGLIERELDVVDYVKTPPPQEPLMDEPGFFLFLYAFYSTCVIVSHSYTVYLFVETLECEENVIVYYHW